MVKYIAFSGHLRI